MYEWKNVYKKGFTLAEVLITLGIIGIVAEMTIPTLMNNIQDTQFKVTWKKNYANLSNIYNMIVADNGGVFKGTYANVDDFSNLFLNKMSYVKKCSGAETKGGCWNTIGAYNYSGNNQYMDDAWWFGIPQYVNSAILKDGTSLYFNAVDPIFNCDSNASSYKECGRIYLDTNGLAKPNRVGKDIFQIYVYPDRLKPTGNGSTCTGFDCSAYYLFN